MDSIPKADLRIETMRGTGQGGQHRNKTSSAVRITHTPTGITAYADERSQHHSRKIAMKTLKTRLRQHNQRLKDEKKKARRDWAVHNTPTIRTLDLLK